MERENKWTCKRWKGAYNIQGEESWPVWLECGRDGQWHMRKSQIVRERDTTKTLSQGNSVFMHSSSSIHLKVNILGLSCFGHWAHKDGLDLRPFQTEGTDHSLPVS